MMCPECFTEYPDDIDFCYVCQKNMSEMQVHYICRDCGAHFVADYVRNARCVKCGSQDIRPRYKHQYEKMKDQYKEKEDDKK